MKLSYWYTRTFQRKFKTENLRILFTPKNSLQICDILHITNDWTHTRIRSFPHVKDAEWTSVRSLRFPKGSKNIYSLTETNGLPFERRITDVRRNDRSRSASGTIPGLGYLVETSGTAAQLARNAHCPSVFGERTREYTRDRRYHCPRWFTKLAGSCQQPARSRGYVSATIVSGSHWSHRGRYNSPAGNATGIFIGGRIPVAGLDIVSSFIYRRNIPHCTLDDLCRASKSKISYAEIYGIVIYLVTFKRGCNFLDENLALSIKLYNLDSRNNVKVSTYSAVHCKISKLSDIVRICHGKADKTNK